MKWISVKEKRPEAWKDVLALTSGGVIRILHRDDLMESWYGSNGMDYRNVTHWMELPTRPDKEG